MTTTSREYLPSPANPRYTPDRGALALREYLRVRCPDLAKQAGKDSGIVQARVRVDSSGKALAAELRGTSGDDVLDGVIGTVAAQLEFTADSVRPTRFADSVRLPRLPPFPAQRLVHVRYACRDSVTAHIVSP
ncbi:MAG: hypothetical protein ACT4R6_10400 [Gemmatimonadaceae bacterium]